MKAECAPKSTPDNRQAVRGAVQLRERNECMEHVSEVFVVNGDAIFLQPLRIGGPLIPEGVEPGCHDHCRRDALEVRRLERRCVWVPSVNIPFQVVVPIPLHPPPGEHVPLRVLLI